MPVLCVSLLAQQGPDTPNNALAGKTFGAMWDPHAINNCHVEFLKALGDPPTMAMT